MVIFDVGLVGFEWLKLRHNSFPYLISWIIHLKEGKKAQL